MTLKQAFTMWACAPRNTVLAAKSREAVQKVLMKKWNDLDLEVITASVAEKIFKESPEAKELKVKAASILVYLLEWGGDHGYCQRPTFDYTIANADPEPAKAEDDEDPLKGIDFDDNKQVADALMDQSARIMNAKPKDDKDMNNEKRASGRAATPVAQLDPETFKVIKIWPSMSEAERGVNTSNITRAIQKRKLAGGYYWCYPNDAEGYKPSPRATRKDAKPSRLLTEFTDQELMDELEARGWKGNLQQTLVVSIGQK